MLAPLYDVQPLFTDQSALDSQGELVLGSKSSHHRFDVEWAPGVTSGAVTVEHGPRAGYTGTWHPITVMNWSAADRLDSFFFDGALTVVRMRISVVIAGGADPKVTARYSGN